MNKGKNSRHPVYHRWMAMKSRCDNKNNPAYRYYGGRGIYYNKKWKKLDNFLKDMGIPKKGMTLDRVDNDGPYTKKNCRWTTWNVQAANKRLPIPLFTYKGKEMSIQQLASIAKCKYITLNHRLLKLGWDIEKAVNTPARLYVRKGV